MFNVNFLAVAAGVAVLTFVTWLTTICKRILRRDVPGPLALPLVGHFFRLQHKPYEYLAALRPVYGAVVRVKFGLQDVIVLNDWEVIRQALASHEFADRPNWLSMKLQNEADCRLAFRPYSPQWRLLRKSVVGALTLLRKRCPQVYELRCQSALDQLFDTLNQSGPLYINPAPIMFRCFVHLVGKIVFGDEFDPNDPQLEEIFASTAAIDRLSRVGYVTDCFPWAELFHRSTILQSRSINRLFDNYVYSKLARHCPHEPVADLADSLQVLSNEFSADSAEHFLCRNAAFDAFAAGLFTSIANSLWALLLLAINPDVQDTLRRELQEVTQGDQPVTLDHRPFATYAEAFLTEVLRFATVLPFAIPHGTTHAVYLNNFRLEKDLPVLPNIWAVHRDESIFECANEFRPERFVDINGNLDKKLATRVIPFGTGMRRCPGEEMAKKNLFLTLTNMVVNFKIEIDPDTPYRDTSECTYNFTRRPSPYRLRFTRLTEGR